MAAIAPGWLAVRADDSGRGYLASPPEIWDSHVHLSSFAGSTPEARAEEALRVATRMGIARLITFMGWPFALAPSPEQIREQNDQVLAALQVDPRRLLGYVYVNPLDLEGSLNEIRRCVVDGPMVGIKLWVAARCTHEHLDPILELATEHQAAIYQHTWIKTTGNLPGESTPQDLVTLAKRHPEARLICGHSGGTWELGLRIMQQAPSVMFEIAGADPTAGITERAVAEFGAERVIFGSDAGGRSFATQMAKILGAEIDDEAKAQILGGNIRRLLTPIMKAKGMLS
ncbi:amidohydrolase family protein [Rubinisphaera margarita]|uniref:amidohydrolase family protein n=1 Tax=Rubinisphaera margarita TaxID=2909586 RepID=UPI001EE90EFA|nr:amidohydrolase family protein [Rubinisphaera margarita]MCG6157730.1 amidohydrolase family protein [Rubinisphaera margarita]